MYCKTNTNTKTPKYSNTKNTRRRRTIMCCAIWKQIKQKLRRTIETLCTCYRLTHWPTDHSHRPTNPPDPPNPPRTHTSPDHFSILWSSTLYVQTNYFLKPHDTHYPLTHWPLTHHPHRPTRPTKNPPNQTISPLYDVLHYYMKDFVLMITFIIFIIFFSKYFTDFP